MKKILTVLLCSGLLVAGACSSLPSNDPGRHIVASSGASRPDWIDTPPVQSKDKRYFVGTSSNVDDETLAREDAKINAMGQIADQVRSTVHQYMNSARTQDSANAEDYTANVEHAIEMGTLSVAKAIVTGVHVKKYYWMEYVEGGMPAIHRDEYALVWLTQSDFQRTLAQTLAGLSQEIHDEKAQHVLKFMKDHYLNDLR